MKLIAVLMMAVLANGAFAESAFEKENRANLTDKNDLLISKVASAREHLKKEDVKEACSEIRDMQTLYPQYLDLMSMHLSARKTKVIVARDEVMNQLIFAHKQSIICNKGENSEHVDPVDLEKSLKRISKSLKKQKKLIKKERTNHTNTYKYDYNFEF